MPSLPELRVDMSAQLITGLLVLSLCVTVTYSQSKEESVALLHVDSQSLKAPKGTVTQNRYEMSTQNFLATTLSSNHHSPPALATSLRMAQSSKASINPKPSVTYPNLTVRPKSSVSFESSRISSILPSATFKDESMLLITTASSQAKDSSKFSVYSSSIPTRQILSPTPSPSSSTEKITRDSSFSDTMLGSAATLHDSLTSSISIVSYSESSHLSSTNVQRVTDNSMVTKIQSTLEAISELSSTEMTIVTTVTPTTVETVTDSGETITTRRSVTPGVTIPAVIGVVVAGSLMLIASSLLILALCYCFCRSRKYEYKTGNEYRVTVQKWNSHFTHYTVNPCDSVSSSRESSLLSLRSANSMKPRYGGVSSLADYVHTEAHTEMYSTPL